MAENLLPCPFCGPSTLKVDNWGAWYVKCEDCDARQTADTKDRAIAEWNRRPAMEAVAWRLRRVGSEQWNFWDTPPWLALPVYADATKWEVQALAVIPTEGGEGRETEGPGS